MSAQDELNKHIARYYTYNRSAEDNLISDWQYSAVNFESELKNLLEGRIIKGIYIDGNEFSGNSIYELHHNYVSMAFGSALSVVVTDEIALLLYIHAEGMMKYAVVESEKLNLVEHIGEPDEGVDEPFLFSIADCDVDDCYENEKICSVEVSTTDMYSFSLSSFDKERAAMEKAKNNLPGKIIISLENGVRIVFIGDGMEYYCIDVKTGDCSEKYTLDSDEAVLEKLLSIIEENPVDWNDFDAVLDEFENINRFIDYDETTLSQFIIEGDFYRRKDGILLEAIRHFLSHGYDLKANDGFNGTECLSQLCWSSYNEEILDAAKCLLDAGAPTKCAPGSEYDTEDYSVIGSIGFKLSGAQAIYRDYHWANVLEAFYYIIK